jgi:cytidylate kinase
MPETIHLVRRAGFTINDTPGVITSPIVIAIDGFSSCGKSTLAKALAKKLNYRYIDSGAMYRAVTLFMLEENTKVDQLAEWPEKDLEQFLDKIHITFEINPLTGLSEVVLNGRNVEKSIRDLRISDLVSPVSAIPAIRHRMVDLQKSYGTKKGIVMDGRDIGTTVFPDAELKLFMTARKEVRAKRRFDELNEKGFMVTVDEVMKNIADRDHTDTHRKESPLRQSEDAIVLDNSNMNQVEQLAFAMELIRQRATITAK